MIYVYINIVDYNRYFTFQDVVSATQVSRKHRWSKTCPRASGGRSLSYFLRTHGNPREITWGSRPRCRSPCVSCWIFDHPAVPRCFPAKPRCFLVFPVSNPVRDLIRQCSLPILCVLFHVCCVCLLVFAWFCISEFQMFCLPSFYFCFLTFTWSSLWSFTCFFVLCNFSMTYRWVLF